MTIAAEPRTLLDRLQRWQWLLPVASFAIGWIGYVAIERGPSLARIVALTALLSWLCLLLEPLAGRWLNRITSGRLSEDLACFVTQCLQQELLFFSLPFTLGAAQFDWAHGVFLLVLAAAALLSTLDLVYQKRIAQSPVAAVCFQVYCTWVAALVVLPIALHLPLEMAAPLAAIAGLLALAAGLPRLLGSVNGIAASLRAVLPTVLALVAVTLLASHLPPAGLRLTEARMTASIKNLKPGAAVTAISADALRRDGLIAFTAIHAPVGIQQKLRFDWYHGSQLVDRIPAEIKGADERARGWRTWTRKQNFDGDPRGRWSVDIRTAGGQLVGRLRFAVY